MIDNVYNATFAHFSFSDMGIRLHTKILCSTKPAYYFDIFNEQCEHCIAVSSPYTTRTFLFSKRLVSFNDPMALEHLFLDDLKILDMINS